MPDQHIKFQARIGTVNITQRNYDDLEEPTETPLNIRVKQSLKEAVEVYAKTRRIKVSEAVRQLIIKGLEFDHLRLLFRDRDQDRTF